MNNNNIEVSVSDEGGSYFIIVDQVKYKCSYAESVILTSLLKNKETFFTKEELAEIGWPNKLVSKNSVPVAIANIRKILKQHTNLDVITNEKNKGYSVLISKVELSNSDVANDIATDEQEHSERKDGTNNDEPLEEVKVAPPTTETRFGIHSIKIWLSKGIGFPLLIINIVIIMLFIFNDNNTPELPKFNVINGKGYIAIYPEENREKFTTLFKDRINSNEESMNLSSLEDKLSVAVKSKKSVLFMNKIGDRVVIDCLLNDELLSYSGNDINTIIDELEVRGCKI
ncbi:transcriptional regulator [Vibrio sp. EA2]|uniref:winged helix-turn-helix domain-containing protein n=1 Tax=Vibrio sp. EA2 TaxID=3079860 RepID=UPI002948F25A|nr:winged helix-turn-helix domain-containing protein [Vibrio sp. EA2]MDV6250072.1 winged helix-turn-helix domain-containing protein [Vibrio sp. EA2]